MALIGRFSRQNTKSAWRLPGWASRAGLLALLLREENISVGLFTLPLREKHWTSVILVALKVCQGCGDFISTM
jgi:hypothetical protein